MHPVVVRETFFWIRCHSSIVRKCSTQSRHSHKEDSENSALLVLFRTTLITPHNSIRGSSPSIFCWMGCRRFLLQVGLKCSSMDDSRSSGVREHGSFMLVSHLHVTILVLWSQCLFPRDGWTKSTHGSLRSCLICVYVFVWVFVFVFMFNRHWHTTLAGWLSIPDLPFLEFVLSRPNKTSFLISWVNEPDGCSLTGLPFLNNCFFWFRLDSLGVLAASSNFWIQLFHPIIFERNLWWWSRWYENFLVYDFSRFHHNNFRDTIKLGVYRRGWLRSILFDRTSILSVEQVVCWPNTLCLGVFSTFSACTMQDVVWSSQAHADLCDPFSWDSQPKSVRGVS